ncbi:uncharacterized protein PAC_08740 [Phialocephala subalpina]|uniref:Uncharacterized protein n=1 Tax=Phialocephala subalpina TaxID=576137 RepID=A0A1L7X1E0_9HELO|nr:uncharacterized protein PAC_08740 [Phialocephala subalpina]
MSLTRADFDNPTVLNAANPSAYGYHHGPIPNNNPGYREPLRAAAIDAGTRPLPNVTPAQNNGPYWGQDSAKHMLNMSTLAAPIAGVRLSTINTGVCDIDVNAGQMCGQVFTAQPSKLRHIRNDHTGALLNPSTVNVTGPVQVAGENAIKRFVVTGGWRDARYLSEPGTGPTNGRLDLYATACERIARNDPEFAAMFGTQFHRRPIDAVSLSGKRKRGPTPPPFNPLPDQDKDRDDSPPKPPSPSAGRKSRGTPKKSTGTTGSRPSRPRASKPTEDVTFPKLV